MTTKSETPAGGNSAGGGRGGFFAIDRRAWALVCGAADELGLGMNAAVAYLALARGTGRDNRTTTWSVNAIEERFLSRGRAQKAIDDLKTAGVVRQTGFGGKATRYELVPAHEIPGAEGCREPLTGEERFLLNRLHLAPGDRLTVPRAGTAATWGTTQPLAVAQSLVAKEYAREVAPEAFEVVPYDAEAEAEPDWIWLPNELVDGIAGEVAPPVELVRQGRTC